MARRKPLLQLSLEPEVMTRLQVLADRTAAPRDTRRSSLNVKALELLLAGLEAYERDLEDDDESPGGW